MPKDLSPFLEISDFVPDPHERAHLSTLVYKHIEHGDEQHRAWLRDKLNEIFEAPRSGVGEIDKA